MNASDGSVAVPDKERIMKLREVTEEVDSCSACYGYLLPALDMLEKEGLLREFLKRFASARGSAEKAENLA